MQPTTMSELVMAMAFAIEDPCGEEAIHLARALIELGRAVPECRRKALTSVLTQLPYLLCHDLEPKPALSYRLRPKETYG